MRRELIEALNYPKSLVLAIINQQDCPHDSLFEATDQRCKQCEIGQQCHWIRCLNEFADFDSKATHTINASLRYGINLVEVLNRDLMHDSDICNCHTCSWVRESRRLSERFEERFATNRYKQLF